MAEKKISDDFTDDLDDLLNLDPEEDDVDGPPTTAPDFDEKPVPKKRAPRKPKPTPEPVAVQREQIEEIERIGDALGVETATESINPTVEAKVNTIVSNTVTTANLVDTTRETPEQARIRELEALLAAAQAPVTEPEPEPLTPDQLRIIELETALAAQQSANESDLVPVEYSPAPKGETILLHFVEDGFSACGQIWYRGQELEFEVGGKAHKQQINSKGKSWLDLVDDIDGQFERWGKQFFAPGPWRGRSWADSPVPSDITDPKEIAEYKAGIKVAEAAERKRNRAAPILRG
jgi:hypothetical protein